MLQFRIRVRSDKPTSYRGLGHRCQVTALLCGHSQLLTHGSFYQREVALSYRSCRDVACCYEYKNETITLHVAILYLS